MDVSKNGGFSPPNHPLKNKVFALYSPSILGVFPLFLVQHPYGGKLPTKPLSRWWYHGGMTTGSPILGGDQTIPGWW